LQLQKQYGYKLDTIPYYQSVEKIKKYANFESRAKGGKIGGKTNVESGQIYEFQKIGCKLGGVTGGKSQALSGMLAEKRLKMVEVTSKPVVATNIKTNEQFIFSSQNEAARKLGVSSGNITSVLKGKGKTLGGYTWKYQV